MLKVITMDIPARQQLFSVCFWTGVCDDRRVWVGIHHPYLVGGMLLSLQRMAGTAPLCQEAFLRHRRVFESHLFVHSAFEAADTDNPHHPNPEIEKSILNQSTICFSSLYSSLPLPSLPVYWTSVVPFVNAVGCWTWALFPCTRLITVFSCHYSCGQSSWEQRAFP